MAEQAAQKVQVRVNMVQQMMVRGGTRTAPPPLSDSEAKVTYWSYLNIVVMGIYCLCGTYIARYGNDPGDRPDPYTSCEAAICLTVSQQEQVQSQRIRISELQNSIDVFDAAKYIETIVELKRHQIEKAINSKPSYFVKEEDLPDGVLLRSHENQTYTSRETRRVCPIATNYAAHLLARDHEGRLVQVIQPINGFSQWIEDETCKTFENCGYSSRLIRAYVINLNTFKSEVQWIETSLCVAKS